MTRTAMSPIVEKLSEQLRSPEFLQFASRRTGLDHDRISLTISQYTEELAPGFNLLAGMALAGKRILEVGAGIGLLSIALDREGCNITALEPGANGFDVNTLIGVAVREWLGVKDLRVLDIEVDRLDPATHGQFDVIFSVNVLEHIPDLPGAIAAMESVLGPSGVMVHLCPNYAVPYEPHFGIILLPFAPRSTEHLVPRVQGHPAWPSLNFVTHRRIRQLANQFGLTATFRRGMMYEAFMRIDTDHEFSARHTGLVRRIYRLLKAARILGLLRYIPPALATPMIFECRRKNVSRASPRGIAASS